MTHLQHIEQSIVNQRVYMTRFPMYTPNWYVYQHRLHVLTQQWREAGGKLKAVA